MVYLIPPLKLELQNQQIPQPYGYDQIPIRLTPTLTFDRESIIMIIINGRVRGPGSTNKQSTRSSSCSPIVARHAANRLVLIGNLLAEPCGTLWWDPPKHNIPPDKRQILAADLRGLSL